MYQWYSRAAACYVYLNDVTVGEKREIHLALRKSQWFTRGWTLQELVAPTYINFVDKNWTTILGDQFTFANILAEITGINGVISDHCAPWFAPHPNAFSVAQRMSWAAGRTCKREEDHAYCLLGLFGVNMPLLYGEGIRKAFQRLQQEILKVSADESIFAWYPHNTWVEEGGMLAPSPAYFRHSAEIVPDGVLAERPDYTITSKGLRFEACTERKITWKDGETRRSFQLFPFALNCYSNGNKRDPIVIFLHQVGKGTFTRFGKGTFTRYYNRDLQQSCEVRQQICDWQRRDLGGKRETLYCQLSYEHDLLHQSLCGWQFHNST